MNNGRMFPFITDTFNPIGGVCPFCCVYCWAKDVIKRYGHKKYSGEYYVVECATEKKFKAGSFVFLCDMLDLFAQNVPREIILKVLEIPKNNPDSKFLLETKNPNRFFEFDFPDNVVLGATVESDGDYPFVSKAPYQTHRLMNMMELAEHTRLPLFISIEPIMDFDLERFVSIIKSIKPWAVAIGYDNYNHKLPEPSLEKTEKFISELEKFTIVYRKTIRQSWREKMTSVFEYKLKVTSSEEITPHITGALIEQILNEYFKKGKCEVELTDYHGGINSGDEKTDR